MHVTIPPELEHHASPAEIQLDLALGMYISNRLTLGQAAKVAGLSQTAFQRELGLRRISIHYTLEDLQEDLRAVKEMSGDDRRQ